MTDVSENARVKSVLEDPGTQRIARVYADAFLDAAGENASDAVEEYRSFVDDIVNVNAAFQALLITGLMNRGEKVALVDRVVAPHGSEFFANFLRVLAKHDRLELLQAVLEAVDIEYETRNGRRRVEIVSAQALDTAAVERVRDRIRVAFNCEPIIEQQVDPKLIGGLVIRVGNNVYDGSLRSRLNQLAKRMQQRSLHEIQSGRDRFSHPEGD
jgi:F-type H+-transporting ATPase subunit delta